MWLKTVKEHVDKLSDFRLGEYHSELENACASLDALDFTFVGKEVSDNLQDMHTYLYELSKEIEDIQKKREAAK